MQNSRRRGDMTFFKDHHPKEKGFSKLETVAVANSVIEGFRSWTPCCRACEQTLVTVMLISCAYNGVRDIKFVPEGLLIPSEAIEPILGYIERAIINN